MATQFGKTWWGEQWLNSLANIDYSNRLPRGSAYARNGSVTSITIEDNIIKAKVKGSQPRPYQVTIIIPPFFEPEIGNLIAEIALKPTIISKLLNRELDPQLMTMAAGLGLKIFPTQWTDFKMQCSCPDWAVPCKHLAAVIYKVSAEIDNNPFLAFTLHKVDLVAALKARNIYIDNQVVSKIPLLPDLMLTGAKPSGKIAGVNASVQMVPVSFSAIKSIHEPLLQLLPEAPVFYQQNDNFKEKYATRINKIVRNATRLLLQKKQIVEFFPFPKATKQPVTIDAHAGVSLCITPDCTVSLAIDKDQPLSIKEAIPLLWQLPPAQVRHLQPAVNALKTSLLLAINLLCSGAVIPQIILLKNKHYSIRWIPALLSKEVKLMLEKLQLILPADIITYGAKVADKDIAVNLVSAWLTELVQRFSETAGGSDLFTEMFFAGRQYPFTNPGEKAQPEGVAQWLQLYYITHSRHKPAIVVDELCENKFSIAINISDAGAPLAAPWTLQEVLTHKKHDAYRYGILQSLAQISTFIPGLDEYINDAGKNVLTMDLPIFSGFLMQAIPVIQLLNINVLLPKALQNILKPKASVGLKQKSRDNNAFIRLDKLLDFDWQVAIGDTVVGENEFKKIVNNSGGLIRYKTSYIYVSQEDMVKLQKHFTSTKDLSAFEMLRIALGNEYHGARVSLTDEVRELILKLTEQKDIPLPDGLNATLRPYQQRGFSWMYRNAQIGFGSVLADDMGLGKTLQVITTLLKYKQDGALTKEKALIVTPTGLLTNWIAEFEKFAPEIACKLYYGTGRKLDTKEPYDVLLTSYGIMRSDTSELKKMKWQVIVIDEAQNIKNYETAQSKAVKSIPANTYIALSGTPVENRLSELWSIMDYCNRGFLGALSEFNGSFANPIQNQNDLQAANKLKLVTGPFLMRRLKSDKSIISDLPDKIEMDAFCNLTKEQAGLYEKTLHKALEAIEEIKLDGKNALFVRQGLVLQMITALKQICNHPTQFLKNKVLDSSLSGKVELLFDKLENIIEANEKVLIFTQFTEMGKLLEHFITERFGIQPLFYHGGCTLKQRKEMVDGFQTNQADNIFILSLKAAGTGLNLTAANHVIHYDLWWNPAVEAQATDRAYRIGQKSNVMVHRFITKNTFEERINEMIQSKKDLANLTVATGENWIGNLNNQELKDIFALS